MQRQTIVVTGGAGYIGSHTALLLAQHGYHVIIIDNLSQHHALNTQQSFSPTWAQVIVADFADETILKNIFSTHTISAVMHFAARIEVSHSVTDPLGFYQNNVVKTISLLEQMVKHGIQKFIFSSSCAVYGEPQMLPITEEHPKNPISPYGKNKLIIEMALHDFQKAYGLEYVSLRYFNAAGALPEYGLGEQHVPESHIIPLLLRAAHAQKPFSIFGTTHPTKDGTCIRDYLHVLDIASAHERALQHLLDNKPSDSFNIGTGTGYSVKQMIDAAQKITGMPIKTINAEKRAGDPPQLIADPTRAHNILQWQPRFSDLDFIMRSAYAFEHRTSINNASHEEKSYF